MSGERRIGVGVDFSAGSKKAVSWSVENLVRKGDHLILIAVLPRSNTLHQDLKLWEPAGSPLIRLADVLDLSLQTKYDIKPDPETLLFAKMAADQTKADVFFKIYWGDPREKLCEATDNIPLSCLAVGSRGLGSIQRVVMGSVSNYVVNNANCPVIVVKPAS